MPNATYVLGADGRTSPRAVAHTTSNAAREAGIAIVSVLMVMSVILMLGVGSLVLTQSNLMTAENLVANSIAKGNADAGIDATVAWLFDRYRADGALPANLGSLPTATLPGGSLPYGLADGGYVLLGDDRVALRVVGTGPRNAEFVAEALVAFTGDGPVDGGSPFHGAVVGCEYIKLNGSGAIDSFDSRVGKYGNGNVGNQGHVKTTEPGAHVELTGGSPIAGDINSTGTYWGNTSVLIQGNVNATGDVIIDKPGVYEGDIRTTGSITLSNTATIYGSVVGNGDITFSNGAKVGGSAIAGGDIAFNNSGALVNGEARAGGVVTRGHNDASKTHALLGISQGAGQVSNLPVPTEECDPLGIEPLMADMASVPNSGRLAPDWWPYTRYQLSPNGITRRNASTQKWESTGFAAETVQVFGRPLSVISVDGFDLGAGEETRVTGGDVVLYVNGDLLATNGNHKLIIEPGSSLTVFVTGKVNLGASFAVQGSNVHQDYPPPVNSQGLPTFSLFSSFSGNDGVVLNGNGKLTASVYAPLTNVKVSGSGETFGAVRGKSISVTGGAALHYDEALAAIEIGGGGGTAAADPSFAVLSRR